MKYFLYDLVTGKATSYLDSPEEYEVSFVEGQGIISAGGYAPADVATVKVVDGVITYNPLPEPVAPVEQIRAMRVALEDAPISTTKGLFDGDQRSVSRLAEAHKSFYDLPLVDGHLEWRRADNTYIYLALNEMGSLLDELATLRAVRTNKLFRAYQTMLSIPDVTVSYVKNVDNWL